MHILNSTWGITISLLLCFLFSNCVTNQPKKFTPSSSSSTSNSLVANTSVYTISINKQLSLPPKLEQDIAAYLSKKNISSTLSFKDFDTPLAQQDIIHIQTHPKFPIHLRSTISNFIATKTGKSIRVSTNNSLPYKQMDIGVLSRQ